MRVNGRTGRRKAGKIIKLKLALTVGLLLLSAHVFSQKYRNRIDSYADFEKLRGKPLVSKYSNVKAVKLVYDIKGKKLYYLNANVYKNHYDFCKRELNDTWGYGNFLKHNYSNSRQRNYLLANLNYFQSLNKYVLELSPVDVMSEEQMLRIYALVEETSFIRGHVFLLNNPRLQAMSQQLNKRISSISPYQIYTNLRYQAISKYSNVGTLRFVDSIDVAHTSEEDIIIVKQIPNHLPPVAGVIVTQFQTPLSHISILGANRKIPICAYKNAFTDKNLLAYKNKQVRFSVKADTFYFALDKTACKRKQNVLLSIEQNLRVDSIVDIRYLNAKSSCFVGNKAANFAELYKISKHAKFKTPEHAFAIPFYFYKQHLIQSKAQDLLDQLFAYKGNDVQLKNEYLRQIRERIKNACVDSSLLVTVNHKLAKGKDFRGYRFRSSTNAEDCKGFSGAGLYASKTGKLNSKKKPVAKAIKKVWASIWSEKAFYEREYYCIDQKNVAMGILVHRSFPNEKVNGVAITKNIYRENSNGFLVNAQLGDENVVSPSSGVICDQFLCFPQQSNAIYKNKVVIDVITYSSLNANNLVMHKDEIQHLANQLDLIKRHFTGKVDKWTYTRIGYDVEFKIDGDNRQLYIKQVRPYQE